MNINFNAACLLLLTLLLSCSSLDARRTSAECGELGFDSSILQCASCNTMNQFVKHAQITTECRECCQLDQRVAAESGKDFIKAKLEVCS
jgi:hypothetical protein